MSGLHRARLLARPLGDWAGVNLELLALQAKVDSSPSLAPVVLDNLRRHGVALDAHVSGRAAAALRSESAATHRQRRADAVTLAHRLGFSALVEDGRHEELALVVDGETMGTLVLRDFRSVLFLALRRATPENFVIEPHAAKDADGARVFADKLSLDSGSRHCDDVKAAAAALLSPALLDCVHVAPLLIAIAADATYLHTTGSVGYHPIEFTFGNFSSDVVHTNAARGLIGFMPVFHNPHAAGTPAYKVYSRRARRAYHAGLTMIF
jgi:hypothetical protein